MPTLTPSAFRRLTLAVVALVAVIIVTGAAVRLTGSGLGCPNWPTCDGHHIVDPAASHKGIESINRAITGLVSVVVILSVLGSLRRVPRRRDLVWLSLGLVAGVVAQIVLGGLVVIFHLYPPLVMGHLVLSMLLLADAVVLHHRARLPDDEPVGPAVAGDVATLTKLLVGWAALVIVLGTVVTGAGPHAGSNKDRLVERLPIAVHDAARFHGTAVVLFLVFVLLTIWRLRAEGAPRSVLGRAELLLVALVTQAAVGYTQYFTGVPVVLVGVHVAGADAVWAAVLWLALGTNQTVVPVASTQARATGEVAVAG
ncbi:MAG: heme a synthase [Actinomycetota bacterium]|jgi:cytochrome c oxidase assembly protein subunit 15|nr:heme a synthase [Actinomycetota bacterium]